MEKIKEIVKDVKGEAKKCFDVYLNTPARPKNDDFSVKILVPLDPWDPRVQRLHPHIFLDGNKIEDVGWLLWGQRANQMIRILLNPILPSRLDGMEMTDDFATMCSFPELLIYQTMK